MQILDTTIEDNKSRIAITNLFIDGLLPGGVRKWARENAWYVTHSGENEWSLFANFRPVAYVKDGDLWVSTYPYHRKSVAKINKALGFESVHWRTMPVDQMVLLHGRLSMLIARLPKPATTVVSD